MKFSIQGYLFREMLATVSRAIENKPVLPILDCVRFDIGGEQLSLTASDTSVTIRCSRSLSCPEEGEFLPFCVPFKDLKETLKGLSTELTFDTDCESRVSVTWRDGEVHLPALTTVDWPEDPDIGKGALQSVLSGTSVKDAIGLVAYAASKEELRPAMCGIRFEFLGKYLEITASDAHILAIAGVPEVESRKAFGITVPSKAAQCFGKMFSGTAVKLLAGKQWAEFSSGNDTLRFRLIEDVYPNYKAVLPAKDSFVSMVTTERTTVMTVLGRIGACSSLSRLTRLSLEDGRAIISAQDYGRNIMGEETFPCELEGEKLDIGLNAERFAQVLDNLPGDRVTLLVNDPKHSVVIRPENFDESKENVMVLITPMMLNEDSS
jgi:DNA polymerase-3 subunit beta